MARQIVVGIDIGSSETRVVIAEGLIERGRLVPKIIGTGSAESKGVYRGYITSVSEAAKSVESAVAKAEKSSGAKVKRAYVSFGGIGLGSVVSTGSVAITRADMEITDRDLAQVLENAEASIPQSATINKKIINTVPIEYKIDGVTVWSRILGLKAQKLEVKALFITCMDPHLADLIATMEEAGIEVVDVVASPVASSFVTISKKEKRVGCLLADIGAETISLVVFENNNLISLEVFPIGGNDITNNIALGLKVNLDEAEMIKLGSDRRFNYSKKKLDEIIAKGFGEGFEMVEGHLKAIGRNSLLPAGAFLAGGSASMNGIKSIAEHHLRLPAQLAEVYFGSATEGKIKDRRWAVACGLSIVGLNSDNEQRAIGVRNGSLMGAYGKPWGKIILRWISQFLP